MSDVLRNWPTLRLSDIVFLYFIVHDERSFVKIFLRVHDHWVRKYNIRIHQGLQGLKRNLVR